MRLVQKLHENIQKLSAENSAAKLVEADNIATSKSRKERRAQRRGRGRKSAYDREGIEMRESMFISSCVYLFFSQN